MEFLDNKSYFDGDKPLIIPHRGGSNIVPENTLHGLEVAIKEEFSHFSDVGNLTCQRSGIPYRLSSSAGQKVPKTKPASFIFPDCQFPLC